MRRLGGLAVYACAVALGAVLAAFSDSPAGEAPVVRVVRSSLVPGERALALSTTSLYARNDPWKDYLAGETVCPGGERTDLPPSRQVATVACLVNFARKRRGLRPLEVGAVLSGASLIKAKEILRCENFAHNPCGGDWTAAVRSLGFVGSVGENLYLASGRFGAPRVAVDAWLNSPRHRANLFGRGWREQGVALLAKQTFGTYRDVSVWVSVLGDSQPA